MKMKNIFLGLVSLFFLGAVTSCDSFLEEKPQQDMSLGQYYKTANHARAGVNALYATGFPTFYDAGVYNGARIAYGPFLSGLYDNEYKGQEVIVQYCQELTISPANITNEMRDSWRYCYQAIGRANTAIKYIPGITDPNFASNEKDQLVAQAKFFRALNYFHLVKSYGDIPLTLDPFESLDDLYLSRTATAQIYGQIETDLKDAGSVLKEEAFVKNGFRISKTTVDALLANVYLQMSGYPLSANSYAKAATVARDIITSNKLTLTQNKDNGENSAYNILRTDDNLTEYIYTRERSSSVAGYASNWTQLSFPVFAAQWGVFKYTLTNNAIRPMPTLINAYDPANDLRIAERQFFFNEYTYTKDGKEVTAKFEQPSPWFYFDEEAMFETGVSGRDFPIMRYPEVLLIAAEAIAQSEGVTAEAAGYLADVRARAYTKMTKEQIVASLTGLSKDAFIQEVWTERIREFSLEHKIWDDIQRTRMYPVTSATNKGKVAFVNVIGAKNPWGATFQEKHLLWPISDTEMQRNPQLGQNNPGY